MLSCVESVKVVQVVKIVEVVKIVQVVKLPEVRCQSLRGQGSEDSENQMTEDRGQQEPVVGGQRSEPQILAALADA